MGLFGPQQDWTPEERDQAADMLLDALDAARDAEARRLIREAEEDEHPVVLDGIPDWADTDT